MQENFEKIRSALEAAEYQETDACIDEQNSKH